MYIRKNKESTDEEFKKKMIENAWDKRKIEKNKAIQQNAQFKGNYINNMGGNYKANSKTNYRNLRGISSKQKCAFTENHNIFNPKQPNLTSRKSQQTVQNTRNESVVDFRNKTNIISQKSTNENVLLDNNLKESKSESVAIKNNTKVFDYSKIIRKGNSNLICLKTLPLKSSIQESKKCDYDLDFIMIEGFAKELANSKYIDKIFDGKTGHFLKTIVTEKIFNNRTDQFYIFAVIGSYSLAYRTSQISDKPDAAFKRSLLNFQTRYEDLYQNFDHNSTNDKCSYNDMKKELLKFNDIIGILGHKQKQDLELDTSKILNLLSKQFKVSVGITTEIICETDYIYVKGLNLEKSYKFYPFLMHPFMGNYYSVSKNSSHNEICNRKMFYNTFQHAAENKFLYKIEYKVDSSISSLYSNIQSAIKKVYKEFEKMLSVNFSLRCEYHFELNSNEKNNLNDCITYLQKDFGSLNIESVPKKNILSEINNKIVTRLESFMFKNNNENGMHLFFTLKLFKQFIVNLESCLERTVENMSLYTFGIDDTLVDNQMNPSKKITKELKKSKLRELTDTIFVSNCNKKKIQPFIECYILFGFIMYFRKKSQHTEVNKLIFQFKKPLIDFLEIPIKKMKAKKSSNITFISLLGKEIRRTKGSRKIFLRELLIECEKDTEFQNQLADFVGIRSKRRKKVSSKKEQDIDESWILMPMIGNKNYSTSENFKISKEGRLFNFLLKESMEKTKQDLIEFKIISPEEEYNAMPISDYISIIKTGFFHHGKQFHLFECIKSKNLIMRILSYATILFNVFRKHEISSLPKFITNLNECISFRLSKVIPELTVSAILKSSLVFDDISCEKKDDKTGFTCPSRINSLIYKGSNYFNKSIKANSELHSKITIQKTPEILRNFTENCNIYAPVLNQADQTSNISHVSNDDQSLQNQAMIPINEDNSHKQIAETSNSYELDLEIQDILSTFVFDFKSHASQRKDESRSSHSTEQSVPIQLENKEIDEYFELSKRPKTSYSMENFSSHVEHIMDMDKVKNNSYFLEQALSSQNYESQHNTTDEQEESNNKDEFKEVRLLIQKNTIIKKLENMIFDGNFTDKVLYGMDIDELIDNIGFYAEFPKSLARTAGNVLKKHFKRPQ